MECKKPVFGPRSFSSAGQTGDGRQETGAKHFRSSVPGLYLVWDRWRPETGDGGKDPEPGPLTGQNLRSPVLPGLRSLRVLIVGYKFQELEVYKIALDYLDKIYNLARKLPETEKFNLRLQVERAATSIVLNIAEGSTGQSNAEQRRFLGLAARSYLETIACMDIMTRREYLQEIELRNIRDSGHQLFIKLQAFRKALRT